MSFSTQVQPLINTYCLSCHGNYNSYSGVVGLKSNIYSRVSSGSMPQNASLTNAQKDVILCWINNGAPNN